MKAEDIGRLIPEDIGGLSLMISDDLNRMIAEDKIYKNCLGYILNF